VLSGSVGPSVCLCSVIGFQKLSRAAAAGMGEQSLGMCDSGICIAAGSLGPAGAWVCIFLMFQGMGVVSHVAEEIVLLRVPLCAR
jgi:hypothetical protein